MKNIKILPILLLLLFASCEKVVEIDVSSIAPKLIIDASFEVFFDALPITSNTVVKLRLSADYFEEDIPKVSDAVVFLTNRTDNTIIPFIDINLNGNFSPIDRFIPQDNTTYELTVMYNNETYKGRAKKIKAPTFISVTQGNTTLFSGKETEVKISFQDDISNENFYLFDFTNTSFLALEDRFFNGTAYNFSFFYQEDEISLPANVTLKMSGITKQYFTYFRVLLSQSGQSGGGPFETVPSSLLGNMINTSNENNFPLGYFHISETDSYNIQLKEKE
ncbi:hypothetical protein PI23P_00195 [Polaribacter irgensii 23-P]|uniref:DUF4249 domain-containing protein n=1 Tax=Polaribacter irgensii 23-P TaxID=313594 RepID=A4C2Q5_9FLAO|nr:DUF4249 family protein [Polaribacter irgensii]EAR11579.1 hypothetical protein PI23P_00195 [Polaribacter irgensii 23-P]